MRAALERYNIFPTPAESLYPRAIEIEMSNYDHERPLVERAK